MDDPAEALRFCQGLTAYLNFHEIDKKTDSRRPTLSVVTPVFNESENLSQLYDRLRTTLEANSLDFEIIFVNDGSQDGSLEIMANLAQQDRRITVVDLARYILHRSKIFPLKQFLLKMVNLNIQLEFTKS